MRETGFIKQNKEKWKEFEKTLDYKDKDPDKLNNLFVQITDDLSYSRTFYPNRSVRVYLNNLAQQIFHSIYKNKKTQWSRLFYFWTDELPQLVYNAKNEFRFSLFIFLLSFAIGVLSSAMDPDFPRIILGDRYVDMTIENIESGDPMAVYKQRGEFGMSLGITANNLYVAFFTFVLGVFFGIGSGAILINNGVMVGAFQYFFIDKGLFWESFLTIWTHGTLEISAIIIAGAAGLTMGRGLVFPGTLTRLQAFQISARRGIKLMIGVTPIFILAGFIEGYLTRYTETPDLIRALFILVCLFFILGYFVVFPVLKARKGFRRQVKDTRLPPDALQKIDYNRINSSSEIFSATFIFFKKYLRQIGLTSIAAGTIYCFITFVLTGNQSTELFSHPDELFGGLSVIGQYFFQDSLPLLPILNILIFSFVVYIPATLMVKDAEPEFEKWINRIITFFKILIPLTLVQLIMMTNDWYTLFLFFFAVPLLILWAYIIIWERGGIIQSLGRTFSLAGNNFGRVLSLFFIFYLTGILFYTFIDTGLLWFYFDVIGWNFSLDKATMDQFLSFLLAFTSIFFISLIFSMMVIGQSLQYYTLLEIEEAPSLKEKIKYIGREKRIQGMEAEG